MNSVKLPRLIYTPLPYIASIVSVFQCSLMYELQPLSRGPLAVHLWDLSLLNNPCCFVWYSHDVKCKKQQAVDNKLIAYSFEKNMEAEREWNTELFVKQL